MSHLIPFNFDDSLVRSTLIDDQPWFVAKDIAAVLEYSRERDMHRVLDDDEKGAHIVRTPGGNQEMTIINQSGLFHAILKSRKPEARRFRKWVTGELLPTLYRDGGYSLADHAEKLRLEANKRITQHQEAAVRLIDKIRREHRPEVREALHAAMVHNCAAGNMPAPPLEALGGPDLVEKSRIDAFWAAVTDLMAKGEELNHSRDPARLAISLPHLRRLAAKHGTPIPAAALLRRCLRASEAPLFIDYRTVRSALFGGSVKCWVFAQEDQPEQEPAE
ncbi:BRO-N domain-containing protein [Halomonas alkalicola]|uniref:BRO-N domain-containing protein n=1 Tax=Halomonas alkalicola TaxID=1930622 RepID=UPI00265F0570|nr:Bro-N domain-containing protein [Halomonas alkalicola]